MSYFVYVLESKKDGSFYIGLSKNPTKRLNEHNSGDSKFTKGRRPYKLIYTEVLNDRLEARKREKYLKTGVGREFLKKLFPCSSVGRARGC